MRTLVEQQPSGHRAAHGADEGLVIQEPLLTATRSAPAKLLVVFQSAGRLRLSGVLDIATRDLLSAVLDETDQGELHVDVRDLSFADAAGLAVLAREDGCRRALGRPGVLVHGCSPLLRRTLLAAGLGQLLPWHAPDNDGERWRARASCRDQALSQFFDIDHPAPARNVCWVCPVSGHCLRFAMRTAQPFGIWGGLTPDERRTLQDTGVQTPAQG